jgi:carbohydrate kinase (thermoresistant glucokinase family)
MIVVVMGVSGAGKTTVGSALADALGCEFLDADEFHPPENVAKMAAATPLTDADRRPWLDRLNSELRAREFRGHCAVLACSALKEAYRARLTKDIGKARLVHLRGNIEFIRARMATRKHKYMPAALLQSQFDTLEPPKDALEIDAGLAVPDAVKQICAALATKDPARTP